MFNLTNDEAKVIISNHIYEAYNTWKEELDDTNELFDSMVASEILFLAYITDNSVAGNPDNLKIIEDILIEAGGTRKHQCEYAFTIQMTPVRIKK